MSVLERLARGADPIALGFTLREDVPGVSTFCLGMDNGHWLVLERLTGNTHVLRSFDNFGRLEWRQTFLPPLRPEA